MVWALKSVAAPASSAKIAQLMYFIAELPLAEWYPPVRRAIRLTRISPKRSKCRPDIEEQRVVVTGITAVAIVIGRRAVELVVPRVLQHQSDILDRQVVKFDDVPAAVRFSCVAIGIGAVETAVSCAGGGEVSERSAVLAVVIVGRLCLERAQCVGQVRRRGPRADARAGLQGHR